MMDFFSSLPALERLAKTLCDTHSWPLWGKLLWACFLALVGLAVVGLVIRWITLAIRWIIFGFLFVLVMIQEAIESTIKGIFRLIWWPVKKAGQLVAKGGKAILRGRAPDNGIGDRRIETP